MAGRKVTDKDIIQINTLFLQYKVKAEVARQTGFSASTVAKYIIPNFVAPKTDVEYKKVEIPEMNLSMFRDNNWNKMTLLTMEEHDALIKMRGEAIL